MGTLAGAALALLLAGALVPIGAQGATVTHYGPPNTAPGWLPGHAASGGAGPLPNDYPAPTPWNQPAGDYCTAYKFAQAAAPATSAPFAVASDTNIGAVTGWDPPLPRAQYQLRHNAQGDSSACQAGGTTWGFWVNANTANNACGSWCGVRHDWSTGQATGTRPWSNGYGAGAKLVMTAYRHVQTYAADLGWLYMCAMLHDTTTGQRLEYCLRVWRSWTGGGTYDAPIIFFDPYIGIGGAGFTAVVSDLVAAGTRYAQNWGGAPTVLGTRPSGNAYSAAITRTHLVNAINDANAQIKSANLGTCLGLLNRIRCYCADPDKYALFGVEDGLEIVGGPTARMGGYSNGLLVYTDY